MAEKSLVEKIERITPLEFLEEVYSCNELPLNTRMRAATAAAPFVHPKLQAIAHFDGGSFADRLDKASRMRNARAIARGEKTLKQIQAVQCPSEEELEEARLDPLEPPRPTEGPLAIAYQRKDELEAARAEGRVVEVIREAKPRRL
jgi:hypothetical protein